MGDKIENKQSIEDSLIAINIVRYSIYPVGCGLNIGLYQCEHLSFYSEYR
jgi:hypothetical protein